MYRRLGFAAASAAALALATPFAGAGQAAEPFSALEIGLAGALNVNRGLLHDFYSPGPGGTLRMAAPFHLGHVGGEIRVLPFSARHPSQPDFYAATVVAEWGGRGGLLPGVAATGGVQLGNMIYAFFNSSTGEHAVTENEMVAGVRAGLSARPTDRWTAYAGLVVHRVFNRVPITLTVLDAGVGYTLGLPAAVREFLK